MSFKWDINFFFVDSDFEMGTEYANNFDSTKSIKVLKGGIYFRTISKTMDYGDSG